MPTNEIPRPQWAAFFTTFTTEHDGWLTSLTVTGRQRHRGATVIDGREMPLRSITIDLSAREEKVVITMGGRGDDLLTHSVEQATRVSLSQREANSNPLLLIEAKNGQTTVLAVNAPILEH
jgi:Family of unknown function (DUF5335)